MVGGGCGWEQRLAKSSCDEEELLKTIKLFCYFFYFARGVVVVIAAGLFVELRNKAMLCTGVGVLFLLYTLYLSLF